MSAARLIYVTMMSLDAGSYIEKLDRLGNTAGSWILYNTVLLALPKTSNIDFYSFQ